MMQASESVDWILSLAGLHHEADKLALFHEMARVLKVKAQVVLADASEGSLTARFLDEWVGRYNPQGHTGEYFTENTIAELEASGLSVNSIFEKKYHWVSNLKMKPLNIVKTYSVSRWPH